MFHLTARVAWHDSKWNGTVCRKPSCNSFCTALDRIREERDDAREDSQAGKRWSALGPEDLPACRAESGAFMGDDEWSRLFVHPYAGIKKAEDTHAHLKPTLVKIPSFATFVVPFAWMLKIEQEAIDQRLPTPLPSDEDAPFNSPWVFGRERQEAILKLFASRITPERSLVFFYCKEGQPLGDTISRLVMGVGPIAHVAKPKAFDVSTKKPSHLMWDLLIRHTIRPDGDDGFLLSYHDYLEPTGDPAEDARRQELLLGDPENDKLSNIIKAFNDMFGNIEWKDGDKIRKVITEEIPARVAQDKAYQNAQANSDKQNAKAGTRQGAESLGAGADFRPHGAVQTVQRQPQLQALAD